MSDDVTTKAAETLCAVHLPSPPAAMPDSDDLRQRVAACFACQTYAHALAAAGLLVTPDVIAAAERAGAVRALRDAADALDAMPSRREQAMLYGREREHADGQDSGLDIAAAALRARAGRVEGGAR